jgi:FkbM family methyltransferase
MKTLIRNLIRKSPLAMALARTIRQHNTLSQIPGKTPWGFKFIGPAGMIQGTFEQTETAIVRSCLKRTDLLINIGANVGFYCAHALDIGKQCIALEPHPDNVAVLLRNIKINQWRAEVHPVACGSKPDVLELYGGGTAASLIQGWMGLPTANSILVPIQTLDDVLGERFCNQRIFCLVDVEGAELGVLDGAHHFLNRSPKPLWMMEICIDEHHATASGRNPTMLETFDRFFSSGYRAYSAEEGLREVLRNEVELIASGGKNTLRGHNFIFSEADIDWLKE